MTKMIMITVLLLLVSCSDSTDGNVKHFDLPSEFPLQVGNAWIYERHFYDQGTDSIQLDTLFISGMHEEYYKYTWRPKVYYSLVKNQDHKLVNFGQVTYNLTYVDTLFLRNPAIWAFFDEDTGFVDLANWTDYQIYANRFHIGIVNDLELFDNLYDTFIETEYDAIDNKVEKFLTMDGYRDWILYRHLSNEIYRRTKLIKMMKNFFPLEKSSTQMTAGNEIKENLIHNMNVVYFNAEGIQIPDDKR